MKTLLYIVYVLNCFFLILTVLLQAGRGGGMALMGAGGSQTVFGNRGAATFVQRLTIYSAVGFMVLSLWIAWLSMTPESADRGQIVAPPEVGASDDDEAPAEPEPGGAEPAQEPAE